MKKLTLLLLGGLVLPLLLTGCGSDSSSAPATPTSEVQVAPSTSTLPLSLQSMILPTGQNDALSVDYSYDAQGQVTGVTSALEFDDNRDGRADMFMTIRVTLDPAITPAESLAALPDEKRSLTTARKAGPGARPVPPGNYMGLPGAVVKIESSLHGLGSMLNALQIPDELFLIGQLVTSYSYDDEGRLLEAVSESEITEESTEKTRATLSYSYAADGKLQQLRSILEVGTPLVPFPQAKGQLFSGYIKTTTLYDYLYDEDGNLTSETQDQLGSDYLYVTDYIYLDGQRSKKDWQQLDRSDDILLDQRTTSYDYDAEGQLILEVETDFDTSGLEPVAQNITTTDYDYDTEGRLLLHDREYDGDANTATENDFWTYTWAYDGEGRLTDYSYLHKYFLWDQYFENLYVDRYVYSAQGLSEYHDLTDYGNDGLSDYHAITSYSYDNEDRLSSIVRADHAAGTLENPGAISSQSVASFSYDGTGRMTEYRDEDYNNAGDIDERLVVSGSYAEDGKTLDGTLESFSLDPDSSELVADFPARSFQFDFATAAPNGSQPQVMHRSGGLSAYDVIEVEVSVAVPALYYLGWSMPEEMMDGMPLK